MGIRFTGVPGEGRERGGGCAGRWRQSGGLLLPLPPPNTLVPPVSTPHFILLSTSLHMEEKETRKGPAVVCRQRQLCSATADIYNSSHGVRVVLSLGCMQAGPPVPARREHSWSCGESSGTTQTWAGRGSWSALWGRAEPGGAGGLLHHAHTHTHTCFPKRLFRQKAGCTHTAAFPVLDPSCSSAEQPQHCTVGPCSGSPQPGAGRWQQLTWPLAHSTALGSSLCSMGSTRALLPPPRAPPSSVPTHTALQLPQWEQSAVLEQG